MFALTTVLLDRRGALRVLLTAIVDTVNGIHEYQTNATAGRAPSQGSRVG